MWLFQPLCVKAGFVHINGKISYLFVWTALLTFTTGVGERWAAGSGERSVLLQHSGISFCLEQGVRALKVRDRRAGTSEVSRSHAPLGVQQRDLQNESQGDWPPAAHMQERVLHGECTQGEDKAPGIQSAPVQARTRSETSSIFVMQSLKELTKFTSTNSLRGHGSWTQRLRVKFWEHSSYLVTQIRGRCLKWLWSCSCHCSSVTRFFKRLWVQGYRGHQEWSRAAETLPERGWKTSGTTHTVSRWITKAVLTVCKTARYR